MASFYVSDDEWNQGEEISLFDMSEGLNTVKLMNETVLEDTVDKDKTKLIYVYDFFSMWTFFVELAEIVDEAEGTDYPNLMFVHGQIPTEAPQKDFKSDDDSDGLNGFDDHLDVDDYSDIDFDDQWN